MSAGQITKIDTNIKEPHNMNEIVEHQRNPMPSQAFSLAPRNLDEAFRLAEMLADSELVPKDFRGKPGNCMIAIQWGAEIGLKPLQALQNLAVINGRPCLWGDALIALVRSSPLCEYIIEDTAPNGTATCRVKRRNEPEQARSFSDADAKTAGLLGKQGPWQTSPARMKQMRARGFALRDVFPDVLKGIALAEEVMDYTELSAPPQSVSLPAMAQEDIGEWLYKAESAMTDDEASAVWKDGSAKIAATKNVADYKLFKAAVLDRRTALKATADAARTIEIDPFVAEMNAAEEAQQ